MSNPYPPGDLHVFPERLLAFAGTLSPLSASYQESVNCKIRAIGHEGLKAALKQVVAADIRSVFNAKAACV